MIREYRPTDLPELRRICLLTGRAGGDATGQYSSDELLPDVFLEPYVTLAPHTAWVAELDGRPVGYLVAALDTARFAERWEAEWAPVFLVRNPAVPPAEQWLRDWRPTPVEGYPAHLHIDLLPEAQGQGLGRTLLRQLGLAAVVAGAPGIHLAMDPANHGARAFYSRLGFEQLATDGDALVLGIHPERLFAS